MNTNKKLGPIAIFFLILVLLGVVGLAAIFRGARHSAAIKQTNAGQPKQVTIAQFGDLLLYLPLYIAADEGYFSELGLQVDLVSTGGDDKTYAAVLAGRADFGVADPTFVAIASAQGKPGKVVGMLIEGMPNYGVAISSNKPVIAKPTDLKGVTVATVPAPSTSYALMKKLFIDAGLEPSIRQVSPSALVSTLQTGQADYALLIEPWVSAIIRGGGKLGFTLMDYYPNFALTGIAVTDTTIANSPETIDSVLKGIARGVKSFYEDPDAALSVAKKRFPGEYEGDLREGIERMRKDRIYPPKLQTSDKAWSAAISLRKDIGDLPADGSHEADIETRFTDRL